MATGLDNLWIYKLAEDLEIEVHDITKKFPRDEFYRSVDQTRRSSAGAANNIKEFMLIGGFCCKTAKLKPGTKTEKPMNHNQKLETKNQLGFTLIELLIYTGLIAVAGGVLTGVLVSSLKIGTRETASAQVTQELNFTLRTIERLVRSSSNIEIPAGISTSTLVLRIPNQAKDPTILSLANGALTLKEGAATTSPLTTDKVIVNSLAFKKFTQYPGHDTVSIEMTMSYNSENPASQVQRTLSSAIARVSAATFDSDLVPGAAYTFNIGQQGSPWQTIYLGDGTSANPSYTFSANTGIGLFRTVDSALGFSTAGLERFRITSSTGNIGIGTSYPSSTLHVAGTFRVSATSTFGGVLDLLSNRIANLGTPTANTDASTKGYVDAQLAGAGSPWTYFGTFGGDGLDGDLTVPVGGTAITGARKQYNNVTLNGPLTLSDTGPSGIFIGVKGTLTINTGGSISVNGKGQNAGGEGGWGGGGTQAHYEQNCVGSEVYYLPTIFSHALGVGGNFDLSRSMPCATGAGGGGGGGGGNGYWAGGSWSASRGGSGGGAASSGGYGGSAVVDATCPTCPAGIGGDASTPAVANPAKISALLFDKISLFFFNLPYAAADRVLVAGAGGGSGGTGGACAGSAVGAVGGAGGGVIYVEANAIVNSAAGAVVTANGANGGNGVKGRDSTTTYGGGGCGAGGGGGGGLIYVRGKTITSFNSSNASATGGSGGTGGVGGITTAVGSTNGGRGGNGTAGAAGAAIIEKVQ